MSQPHAKQEMLVFCALLQIVLNFFFGFKEHVNVRKSNSHKFSIKTTIFTYILRQAQKLNIQKP